MKQIFETIDNAHPLVILGITLAVYLVANYFLRKELRKRGEL